MSKYNSKQLLPLVKKPSAIVYFGAVQCEARRQSGQPCPNQAYYVQQGSYRCGVHSKQGMRQKLPSDRDELQRKQNLLTEHRFNVSRAAEANRRLGLGGQVQCQPMQMMKPVPLLEGFLNVFPNNRHQERIDGFGCCALSPMRLGPVLHRQPGLPAALSIENYHQFNKVFACEVDRVGNPKQAFYVAQRNAYEDPVPHRHKFEKLREPPLFSLHLGLDGTPLRYSYVQSRYFYCCAYESLAKQQADFATLQQQLARGTNLMICGYDARPVEDASPEGLDALYADPERPFGHELVLYCLLTIDEPEQYPWHRYRRANALVYENAANVL